MIGRAGSGGWWWMVGTAWAALAVAGCSGRAPGTEPGADAGTGHAGGAAGGSVAECPAGSGGQAVAGAGGGAGAGGAAGILAGGVGGAAGISGGGTTGAAGGGAPGCSIPTGPPGAWVEVAAPSELAGFAATDAYAFGSDDLLFAGGIVAPTGVPAPADDMLVRWNHGCWAVELTISPTIDVTPRASVHGTGPYDVWATAGDLLYHRNAQGWTRFTDDS
ncbi:MAG: hypothetical protein ABUR63_11015, partial [Verrucomicrobiota bacterium]